MYPANDITGLISEWRHGNKKAESELFETLYRTLRGIALKCLKDEERGQTLSPTVLVNEAYLKLVGTERLSVADRNHFLAIAARVMRRVVVDKARARRASKRDREVLVPTALDLVIRSDAGAAEIVAIDRALDELARHSPRQAQLIELHYFVGYSFEESAVVMGISPRTIRREWQLARTHLRIAIDGTNARV